MMWRSNPILLILLLLSGVLSGQTPPPPPPPPFNYTPPTPEEQDRAFADRAATIDELLFPLKYYQSKDEIYFESSDSLRAARKLRRAYILYTNAQGESSPSRYYTWYDQSGRPEQTSSTSEKSNDSTVHKWKYDADRRVKCYITLTYRPAVTKGQWNYSGDSVLMKYNVTGAVTEITRYSIRNSVKTRTSSFTSKSTFSYNQNGWMILKTEDANKFSYAYDAAGHPVMITRVSANGHKFNADSFAWRTGAYRDTVEHWTLRDWGKAMLIDRLILNNRTGEELVYTLYPDEKENYIRNIYGPLEMVYSYDAGYRMVKRAGYTLDGVLNYETTFKYDQYGFSSGFALMHADDPAYDPRPLPPAALIFTGQLYVATEFTYTAVNNEQLPSQMNYGNILVGIKGDTREILARGNPRSPWKIIAEFYP